MGETMSEFYRNAALLRANIITTPKRPYYLKRIERAINGEAQSELF